MTDTLARKPRLVDHLVLPVVGLDEARKRLSGLGFQVAPAAQHPFGTANLCSFFADDTYLEMLAVDRPSLYEKALARDNSFIKRDRAYRFRNGENGFSAIALKTENASVDHAGFRRNGLYGGRMVAFSRLFTTQEGMRSQARFRLAFAADLRAPDAFFFTCQRVAYPVSDRTHLTAHANGVTGLRAVLMCEAGPQDFAATLSDVFQSSALKGHQSSLEIHAGNADIQVLTPDFFSEHYGWQPQFNGRGLRLAGLVFAVSSLHALEELFTRGGIVFSKREGRILVAPAPGQGALFVFEGSKS